MQDYLLFVDIEASGLPRKWNVPYSQGDNWPHAVQVAWLVYTVQGEEVKREDHYLRPDGFTVTEGSIAVHGLTPAFLQTHGKSRGEVLRLLQQDLAQYAPMVIGHFMQFDFHVLSADFYRENLPSPFAGLPTFCTMLASSEVLQLPRPKFLHLGELYAFLFRKPLEKQHHALVDAAAAADCFFELRQRGFITQEEVARQQKNRYHEPTGPVAGGFPYKWAILGAGVFLLLFLLYFWL